MRSHAVRALALAAHRLSGGDARRADAIVARIAGADGIAARAELAALRGAGGEALADRTHRELAAPRPARWHDVHPTWIEAALQGEGAAVRALVTVDSAGSADASPHERHLARVVFGELVPMPDPSLPAIGVAALALLDAGVLGRALAIVGRRQLAHALTGFSSRAVADLAARLPWGKALIADVAALAALGDAAAEARLGRRTAAREHIAGITWSDALAPTRVGLRAIAAQVATVPDLAAQLAQRLPRAVGTMARAELATGAASTLTTFGPDDAEIALAIVRATVA